jgi:hypothetical protein
MFKRAPVLLLLLPCCHPIYHSRVQEQPYA